MWENFGVPNMTTEDKQKLAQEKLAEAYKALDEAVALAEEGGFELSFDPPGTRYYPSTLFSREECIEAIKEDMSEEEFTALTPEEFDDLVEGQRSDWTSEHLPEYAELGQWWQPSRIC